MRTFKVFRKHPDNDNWISKRSFLMSHANLWSMVFLHLIIHKDFLCAWKKEVLIQGKLFMTERAIYFYSKILWVYEFSIPLDDIVLIEKKYDAVSGIFPNSLLIHAKNETVKISFSSHFLVLFVVFYQSRLCISAFRKASHGTI